MGDTTIKEKIELCASADSSKGVRDGVRDKSRNVQQNTQKLNNNKKWNRKLKSKAAQKSKQKQKSRRKRIQKQTVNEDDDQVLFRTAIGDDPSLLFAICERDGDMDALQRAAAFGSVQAQFKLGLTMPASDNMRYWYWGKACAAGYNPHFFVLASCKQWRIRNYRSNPNVICSIGSVLAPFLDTQKETVYGITFGKDEWEAVRSVVDLHLKWANSCRQAMDLFSLFAKAELRQWINADVRKLIARMIWRERFAYMTEDD